MSWVTKVPTYIAAVPKSRVTTSTRYSGITTLYRILPTTAVLAAMAANESYTNPTLGARGRQQCPGKQRVLSRGSQPPPAHTSCLGRRESCEGLHTYGFNRGLCRGRLHGICGSWWRQRNEPHLSPCCCTWNVCTNVLYLVLCTVCYKLVVLHM